MLRGVNCRLRPRDILRVSITCCLEESLWLLPRSLGTLPDLWGSYEAYRHQPQATFSNLCTEYITSTFRQARGIVHWISSRQMSWSIQSSPVNQAVGYAGRCRHCLRPSFRKLCEFRRRIAHLNLFSNQPVTFLFHRTCVNFTHTPFHGTCVCSL